MKIALFILSLIAFYALVGVQIRLAQINREGQVQAAAITVPDTPTSLPVRLRIPAISVMADVEQVGLTPLGDMDVPSSTDNVGWFVLGARPGQKGNTVIAGHLNSPEGADGVFANLSALKTGDKLYVEDNLGKTVTFIVRGSSTYPAGRADEVYAQTDGTHLNLITCDGTLDKITGSYTKRLVVFTDLED